jgi:hypothetical protein
MKINGKLIWASEEKQVKDMQERIKSWKEGNG